MESSQARHWSASSPTLVATRSRMAGLRSELKDSVRSARTPPLRSMRMRLKSAWLICRREDRVGAEIRAVTVLKKLERSDEGGFEFKDQRALDCHAEFRLQPVLGMDAFDGPLDGFDEDGTEREVVELVVPS
jgi:hypothetical protein